MTFCHGLKLVAPDGKQRETDCANTEGLFRIIQSVPSPKAEPFKRWLAQVGYERVKEIENPELASSRARELYQAKGFTQNKTSPKQGGTIAGDARRALEAKTGKRVVSRSNNLALPPAANAKRIDTVRPVSKPGAK